MNELQREDLRILKTLDKFCKENNFTYFLHAGTLLGAIRHQGFIPWDDDVDIAMKRKTFDDFELAMVNSDLLKRGYHYQSNKYSDYYSHPFSKLRSDTLDIIESVPKTQHGFTGPWVDIFPLDNVPDDENSRRKQFKKVSFYDKLIALFLLVRVRDSDKGIKKFLKNIIEKTNEVLYKHYFFMDYLYNKRLYHMTKYNDQETKFVGELSFPFHYTYENFSKTLVENRNLENLYNVKFESLNVPIPENSEIFLTRRYGDYMKLPPIEERKIHQIEY